MLCRELDDLHSGAIRKGALPDSRPEGDANPKDGDLVRRNLMTTAAGLLHQAGFHT